jgi:hypothetical protein
MKGLICLNKIELNTKFKIGQKVICTLGSNRGKEFTIVVIFKYGYSCLLSNENDGKYYFFTDDTLELSGKDC